MISYWGVDHGEVSKAADNKYGKYGPPTAGRRAAAYAFGPWHGAVAGKKGKKLKATGTQLAGNAGGAYGGAALGGGAAALATKGNPIATQIGASLGSIGGAVTGSQLALNRNQRKGYLKRQY